MAGLGFKSRFVTHSPLDPRYGGRDSSWDPVGDQVNNLYSGAGVSKIVGVQGSLCFSFLCFFSFLERDFVSKCYVINKLNFP
jgi:hypothetical protein